MLPLPSDPKARREFVSGLVSDANTLEAHSETPRCFRCGMRDHGEFQTHFSHISKVILGTFADYTVVAYCFSSEDHIPVAICCDCANELFARADFNNP